HRQCGRSCVGRSVVESDRSLLAGLHYAANGGQGQILQDAGFHSQEAARSIRRGGAEIRGAKPAVQGDRRIAAGLCQAGDTVGAGLRGEPPYGVRALFRTEREETDLRSYRAGKAPSGRATGWRLAVPVASHEAVA